MFTRHKQRQTSLFTSSRIFSLTLLSRPPKLPLLPQSLLQQIRIPPLSYILVTGDPSNKRALTNIPAKQIIKRRLRIRLDFLVILDQICDMRGDIQMYILGR